MIKAITSKYFCYCYLILSSILYPVHTRSANRYTDSIYNIINVSKEDSNVVKLYNKLAWELAPDNIDSSIILCRKALSVSGKIKYEKGIADCINTLGTYYYMKQLYDSALFYYNNAIEKSKKNHNIKILASAYSNIALTYNVLCEYKKSIRFGFLALELREMYNDTPGISKSLNNIGTTYHYMGRYNDAIEYYSQSLKLKELIGNKQDISSTLNNIGLIYFEKGVDENQEYFDSSFHYHYKALDYRKEIGFEAGIAESYINIGNVFSEMENSTKALYYYKLGKTIFNKLENNTGLATLFYNIAYMHFKNNELDSASIYFTQSIEIAKKINSLDLILDNYSSLTEFYALQRDYINAYKYSLKYNTLYDSIFTIENNKQIAEIKTDYEAQKHENLILKKKTEIELLKLKRTRTILIISVTVILAISILLIYIVKSLYNSKKTTKILVDQNFIITQKSNIITENINYAKIIQSSLLPSHNDLKTVFPNSFLLSMPKDIVGGDFIWYKNINDVKIIAMVDCTGHGVSAAFMSVIGNTLLNKIIIEEGILEPSKILFKINLYLTEMLSKQTEKGFIMDGMDIALFTIKNNILNFSGSQMPICMIQDGHLSIYKGTRFSIGGNILNKKCEFDEVTIETKKSDYIYMFSDGYYDQFGGELFRPLRFKNFQNMLLSNYNLSMAKQKEFFKNHMAEWIGDYEQIDDITLLGIKL